MIFLQDEITDATKQKIAAEINLSETAFVSYGWTQQEKLVTAEGSQLHRRTIRWFTPTNEVELCGHATLASTKALVEAQLTDLYITPSVKTITISFESKFRGKLGAALNKDTDRINLNFPSNPSHILNKQEHSKWLDEMISTLLGRELSAEIVTDVQYSPATKILLIRLSESSSGLPVENLIRKVSPDFQKLTKIDTGDLVVHDVIVTVKGPENPGKSADGMTDGSPHFYSRFFAPWDGIDEVYLNLVIVLFD